MLGPRLFNGFGSPTWHAKVEMSLPARLSPGGSLS
jgi:hypothetical protein